MANSIASVLLFQLIPFVLAADFPLTAISHYSELSPCAVSHLSVVLDGYAYNGCSSANTPISAYGSCLCAQRLSTVQKSISFDFKIDAECSSTGVQPFLTAFCGQWGVDIGAAEKAHPSTTTAVGGGLTRSSGTGECNYSSRPMLRRTDRYFTEQQRPAA